MSTRRVARSVFTSALAALVVGLGAAGAADTPPRATATFAGGCFWCMEPPFEKLDGVISTVVGYTGGSVKDPTYERVSSGSTGHAEAIQVVYDPSRIAYGKLLDVFWHNIDPLTANAQFCDHGNQYRSAIFYHDDAQRAAAEASKTEIAKKLRDTIATQIVPASDFWRAEDYHQRYHEKNPIRYKYYRWNCGRDARLKEVWGADAPPAMAKP